jgi:uncharacterized membrane protein YhaH (DUF805 family)
MEWMLLPLKRYADFQGRSRRMEYWMFALGILIASIVIGVVVGLIAGISGSSNSAGMFGGGIGLALFGLLWLAIIVPSIAVQVRRFHDQNLTGWLVLLNFIPYLGGLVVLVFMCLPGTKGPNKFGPDPLDTNGVNVADVFR